MREKAIAVLTTHSQDPGAILTTWTIYHLSRQPDLVKKLQEEIERQ